MLFEVLPAKMDYGNDADPMISSAIFPEASYIVATQHHPSQPFEVLDFDTYSRPTMLLDESANDIDMTLDSPVSVDTYNESDMELGFQDSHSVGSPAGEESNLSESASSTPLKVSPPDSIFEADARLVHQRFSPYDVFPNENEWTLEEKVDRLIELSPCKKYPRDHILNLDTLESPDRKVDILIDLVARIPVNFRWNYVKPHELVRSYTVVTACKKEKKKDADGKSSPKRPMNAFMIWSKKCRALIAHIYPQLHNAVISTKLGAAWRKFDSQEKALYEREKEKLTAFHQHEFPNYKYKPRKKAKKSEVKKPPSPKPKASRKKKAAERNQPAPLRGINIADSRQNLSPHLKERLQVKMQVKIDPNFKKGIGKRVTAIDLADLTAYRQGDMRAISPSITETQGLHSTEAVHLVIDSKSSVFDTPENSPNTPITPVTPVSPAEQTLVYGSAISTRGDTCFDFDDKSTIHFPVENNNNIVVSAAALDNNNMKTGPNWTLSIKTEPQDYPMFNTASIIAKTEPDFDDMPQMPILSAEAVEAILESGCTSNLSGFNTSEFFNDFMSYLDTDTDICSFPIDTSLQLQCVPEGPATV